MKKHMRSSTIALLTTFLFGCTTVGLIEDQNESLGPNEVILLARVTSPKSSIVLSTGKLDDIYNAPVSEMLRSISLQEGENLLAIKVKKGEIYKISRYHAFGRVADFTKGPFLFQPAEEGMTYIGDIVLEPNFLRKPTMVNMRVIDNEQKTVELLKQKYRALFERYQYQKIVPSSVR